MKCACGDKKCTTQTHIDTESATIIVERTEAFAPSPRTASILVQLNPDLTVALICQLRETLLQFTRGVTHD